MDIGDLTDIKNPASIKSLVEVNSLAKVGCYFASFCILVLSCILILGFKLQPDLIALCASLGPEVFLPFSSQAYSLTAIALI